MIVGSEIQGAVSMTTPQSSEAQDVATSHQPASQPVQLCLARIGSENMHPAITPHRQRDAPPLHKHKDTADQCCGQAPSNATAHPSLILVRLATCLLFSSSLEINLGFIKRESEYLFTSHVSSAAVFFDEEVRCLHYFPFFVPL
jgi:hypothetical protein